MSNSVQLKHVSNQGNSHPFHGTQMFLGVLSILMCAVIGKLLSVLLVFGILTHQFLEMRSFLSFCYRFHPIIPLILVVVIFVPIFSLAGF